MKKVKDEVEWISCVGVLFVSEMEIKFDMCIEVIEIVFLCLDLWGEGFIDICLKDFLLVNEFDVVYVKGFIRILSDICLMCEV